MKTEDHPSRLKYRILASDIDATLLNSQGKITDATREALKKADQAGVRVILCSGRRFRTARPYSLDLGFDVPVVTNCGALMKDTLTEETLYRHPFSKELCEELIEFLLSLTPSIVTFLDTPLDRKEDFLVFDQPEKSVICQKYLKTHSGLYSVSQNGKLSSDAVPVGICVLGEGHRNEEIQARVRERFRERVSDHIMQVPTLDAVYEIFATGTSKWNALSAWALAQGIDAKAIATVGDEMNDMEMISKAGLGAAMGNAIPELKETADLILPTNDEDGLVVLVDHILKSQEANDGF